MPGKVSLTVVEGGTQGDHTDFVDRGTCIIGRAADANIRLPDDQGHRSISRYHCLLDINPPSVRIRDFGSLNGTFVNAKKIGQRARDLSASEGRKQLFPEHDLKHGDRIKLGTTVLQVEIQQPKPTAVKPKPLPPSGDQLGLIELLLKEALLGKQDVVAIRGYKVIRELGKGGMGAVYLASHQDTGKVVALKVMLPKVAVDQRAEKLFLRETTNTKALQHPNIVQIFDHGCSDNTFYFTLEFCDGGSVDQLMTQRGGRLPVAEAMTITLQALDGLAYAHSAEIPQVKLADGTIGRGRGLVHRDLKPANLYLSGQGGARVTKVADFGLAKAFDLAGLSGQTMTGSVSGTPVFMPRQQVINFKFAKPEVDIWAMAACFYNMVTGVFPRDYKPGQDPWLITLKTRPVPIRRRNGTIPAPLAAVIDTALDDSGALHFKSVADFKQALLKAQPR